MSGVRFADITPEAVVVTVDVAEVLGVVAPERLLAECERRGLLRRAGDAPLTGAQVRGARGLLGWSANRLSNLSGVSVSTIMRLEDGTEGQTRPANVAAVRRALERGGAVFLSFGDAPCLGLAGPAPVGAAEGGQVAA